MWPLEADSLDPRPAYAAECVTRTDHLASLSLAFLICQMGLMVGEAQGPAYLQDALRHVPLLLLSPVIHSLAHSTSTLAQLSITRHRTNPQDAVALM